MHRFQNFVGAGLQRQVNVLGEFRQTRDRVDQVFAEADRVGRRETQPLQPFDLVNGFEQLHKWRFTVDLRKLVATVKIHDLSE